MRRIFGIAICMLIAIGIVEAQTQGDGQRNFNPGNMPRDGYIAGMVKDNATGEPVEFASVALYSQRDSSLITGTITNEEGKFEFAELPYGMFYLEVRFVGYKNMRLTKIMVNPQKKAIEVGDIPLNRSVTELEGVEVVGTRPQMEYKIDRKVVYAESNITAAGGTAVDILENTPSIQTDIDGNVTLRGSSNFTVLIDGKPTVFEGSEGLQQIAASTIDRIEIITNPSAKYDPDGTAGIINVVLKKQKRQGFNGLANASYGRFNQYSADVLLNYRIEKINFFTGFNTQDRTMSGTGLTERESYLNDTTFYLHSDGENEMHMGRNEFKAGLDYYINDMNTLSLQGDLGSRGFGRSSLTRYHDYSIPAASDLYYLQDDMSERKSDYYSLTFTYDHNFDKLGHDLKITGFYSRDNDHDNDRLTDIMTNPVWIENDPHPFMQKSTEAGNESEFRLNADYVKPVGETGKFEAGYQLRYETGNTDYHYYEFDHAAADWRNFEDRNNSIELARDIQAGYAIFGTSTKIVDFQVGLRAEYTDRILKQLALDEKYSINRLDFFPSAHITKKLPFEQQLQLSYSRRINRPRDYYLDPFPGYIDQLNIRVGNPGLEPEYVGSYELNYQKKFKDIFLTAELYYRQTNNMMSRINYLREDNIMIQTMKNIGSDHSLGTEVMLTANPWKWWDLSASGTIFRYRIDGEIEGEDVNRTTNTWNARLNNNFKLKWDTRIQLMAFYEAPSVTAQGDRGGFFMINGGIRQDFFNRKFTATLQVRDIFGTMKMSYSSKGSNFYTYNERRPYSPVYTISLSYRINNYTSKKKQESGDSMEMNYGQMEEF